jgi:hypothetical protein
MTWRTLLLPCFILSVVVACGGDSGKHGSQAQDGGLLNSDAGQADAGARDAAAPDAAAPALPKLSATGLYADIVQGTLGKGVRAYQPQGELWADGASKARWVYLPKGAQIDSTDMDGWLYPVGTKLWKEFRLADKRIETRLLEKTGEHTWTMLAFQWNDAQTEAIAVPDGVKNASGTEHDIPSSETCKRCHAGVADTALGFSAVQLAHTGEGVTLDDLVKGNALSAAPAAPLVVPGDQATRATLLYLHANCGHCHNARSFISGVTGVDFWLRHDQLEPLESTQPYHSLEVDLLRSKDVEQTQTLKRMLFRGQGQMPPVARKQIDTDGVAQVKALLETIPLPSDGGVADAAAFDAALDAAADAGL